MKRFIILNADGSVGMNATSGHLPPNYLCDAHDDWVIDELTYSDGIVYVDPEKVRRKALSLEQQAKLKAYEDFQIKVTRAKQNLKKKWWLALIIVMAIAVYYLSPLLTLTKAP